MTNTAQTTSTKLLTGVTAPNLEIATLDGQVWRLSEQKPQNYTAIFFYRGLHCPLCEAQLAELDQKLEKFAGLGIEVIAISGDSQEKAQQSKNDWGLKNLTIGYGLSEEAMRRWGLYLSHGAFANEPKLFSEPAIFLIKPCGQIAFSLIGNTPFARPRLDDLIGGLDYILQNNYPIRGNVA